MNFVIAHLEAHFREALKLEYSAGAVNLSCSRLRHLFKHETGMSFAQYIKQLRMHKARELLEDTFLRVKEIMVIIGVTDESHFVRDFKEILWTSSGTIPCKFPQGEFRHNSAISTNSRYG